MIGAHALAHMANTWVLLLHPGVDHRFQRYHIIAALGTIKAFKPVHRLLLSFRQSHNTMHQEYGSRNDWCLLYHFHMEFTILTFPNAQNFPMLLERSRLGAARLAMIEEGGSWQRRRRCQLPPSSIRKAAEGGMERAASHAQKGELPQAVWIETPRWASSSK
jgi:hypothetical protein